MLQPKKRKYRKDFRGKRRGKAQRGNSVDFGTYGIKATTRDWITARQIEAARKTITHHTKRVGKLWIRIFPDKPITHKAAGSKMGSGKGDIEEYVSVVKPGRIIFEISGVSEEIAKEAFRKASHKLSVNTKFVSRD
jgi:large subunit ribosomal protein L16